jgi:hypothetical protein
VVVIPLGTGEMAVGFAHAACIPSGILPVAAVDDETVTAALHETRAWCEALFLGDQLLPAVVVGVESSAHVPAGEDIVDVGVSTLLGFGMQLVLSLDVAALAGLSFLPAWSVRLDGAGGSIRIEAPAGMLYGGTLGPAPVGWVGRVRAARRLLVLVGSMIAMETDPLAGLVAGAAEGRLVGGMIPVAHRSRPAGKT